MEQALTIVGKLKPSIEIAQEIEATLFAFADACNYANEQVKSSITSKTTIQNMVYQTIREKFGLSANLAVRACARVGANRKTAKLKNKPVKLRFWQFHLNTRAELAIAAYILVCVLENLLNVLIVLVCGIVMLIGTAV